MESFLNADVLFAAAIAAVFLVAGILALILLHFLHFIRNVEDISETARRKFRRLAGDIGDIRGDSWRGRRSLNNFILTPRPITHPREGKKQLGSHSAP
ncbi:MAG: hypothetical protein Q8Q94_01865 [bacterium]|nr:hypothetical protein [bacterium]MDZ4299537.1 hypothetical protein [Candidatus Sungbacteria bacterium]